MISGRAIILMAICVWRVSSVAKNASGRESGLYLDNGRGQTVVHGLSVDEETRNRLEQKILKLLGIPERPRNSSSKARLMRRSAPNFLLKAYESSLNGVPGTLVNVSEEKRQFFLTEDDVKRINESDSIVTFAAKQKHRDEKPEKVKRMWFDVGASRKNERMTLAQLRLYRGPNASNRKNRGAFTITVYRMVKSNEDEKWIHPVDSVNTTAGQEGWLSLNVTESLSYWINNPGDNKGFLVEAKSLDREARQPKLENIGIVGFKDDAEHQPFMIGFFESTDRIQLHFSDFIGSENILDTDRRVRRSPEDFFSLLKRKFSMVDQPRSTKVCGINEFYIKFKDINMDDSIIAPEGFEAHFCQGECKYPLSSNMNATNHALVQSLVKFTHKSDIPDPCCVPEKLSTISVLYLENDNNVVYRKYKEMSVSSCGCH